MTLACSSAVSNVSSENVVHSIDRNKISSASLGEACRAIMEGRGPLNAGKTYITFLSAQAKNTIKIFSTQLTRKALSIVRSAVNIAIRSISSPWSLALVRASLRSLMSAESARDTRNIAYRSTASWPNAPVYIAMSSRWPASYIESIQISNLEKKSEEDKANTNLQNLEIRFDDSFSRR